MKSLWIWIIIAGAVGSAALISSAAGQGTGGDQGWYVVHCNVYGANVYFDNNFVGTIQQGTLTFPALTTGSYQTLTVRKNGYTTYTQNLTLAPGKGESVDLYATLNPLPDTTPTIIGGDMGWYIVRCNIDGATVTFDGIVEGTIDPGNGVCPGLHDWYTLQGIYRAEGWLYNLYRDHPELSREGRVGGPLRDPEPSRRANCCGPGEYRW